jgi:DedD protein
VKAGKDAARAAALQAAATAKAAKAAEKTAVAAAEVAVAGSNQEDHPLPASAKKPKASAVAPAAPSEPVAPNTAADGKRFAIQVKAFRSEADAQAFQQQLKDHGFQATVSSAEVQGQGAFFRVRIGPFLSLEQAKAAQKKLEQIEDYASIILVVGG